MDDVELHLEADRLFGPCNDPACPGAIEQPKRRHLQVVREGTAGGNGPAGSDLVP